MIDCIDAIIVAAGAGKRLGSPVPKAFTPLAGKPLMLYSIEAFVSHNGIRSIIIVVPQSHLNEAAVLIASLEDPGRIRIASGGAERWESVRNGIALSQAGWILVHDAARPFVSRNVIDGVIAKRENYACVITATPAVDTMRTFEGDKAGETVDRSKLVRVGTPQLFRRDILYPILKEGSFNGAPTDEAMLMQQHGHDIGIAWGDARNFKITTEADMEIAEALLARSHQVPLGGE